MRRPHNYDLLNSNGRICIGTYYYSYSWVCGRRLDVRFNTMYSYNWKSERIFSKNWPDEYTASSRKEGW